MAAAHPPFEPDPVIEAYKKDVDRSLIRENLKLSHHERVLKLIALAGFDQELRRAGDELSERKRRERGRLPGPA
jgi:hypothetical protein